MITVNGKVLPISEENFETFAESAVAKALEAGATQAACRVGTSESEAITVRDGAMQEYETEPVKIDVSLSVWLGHKVASVSATGADDEVINWLVAEALGNAEILTEEDPHRKLAVKGQYLENADALQKELDLEDSSARPSIQEMMDIALEIERGMMSVDGFTKSFDAGFGYSQSMGAYATSEGFVTSSGRTSFYAYGVAGCEGNDGILAQGYKQKFKTHLEDLNHDWFAIGQEITEETLKKRDEKPLKQGGKLPIVFDRKIATGLIGHILSGMDGMSVYRKQTFLNGKLGQQALSENLTIHENPFKKRGLASSVCSRSGIPRKKQNLVENGVINTWLLGLRSASHLDMEPTGHDGGTTNITVPAGDVSVDELIKDIEYGVYVTHLMGHGYDTVTGNYSRSAGGFAIENGKITHPIKNCVIASTMQNMFSNMTFANDLILERSVECPTVRIAPMQVSV